MKMNAIVEFVKKSSEEAGLTQDEFAIYALYPRNRDI